MKQGHAQHSGIGSTKVEPNPQAVNPQWPVRLGMQVIPTRPTQMYEGRGLKAPLAGEEVYRAGSQGRH
jgi:hypothetical protein